MTLELVFAGLVGGIVWNLLTWLLGIPSSSSHALIGGIVGATIAAVGAHGVIWKGIVSKVLIPAVVAAILAVLVGAIATWLVYRITRGVPEERTEAGFRYGQMGLGLAGLAGTRHQRRAEDDGHHLPGADVLRRGQQERRHAAVLGDLVLRRGDGRWAPTSAAGGSSAPWARASSRSSRRRAWPPSRLRPQSFCCPAHFGYALSTTQVCTGSVLGSGVGKPGAEVRWGVAGRMAVAWLVTLPSAGLVGAVTYWIVHVIGGYAGAIIGFSLLVAVSAAIYMRSRKVKVDHKNVNDDWEGSLTAGLDADDSKPSAKVGAGPGAVRLRRRHRYCEERRCTTMGSATGSTTRPPEDPGLRPCWPGPHCRGCSPSGSGCTPSAPDTSPPRRHRAAAEPGAGWRSPGSSTRWCVAAIIFGVLYIARDFIAHTRTAHPRSQAQVTSNACRSTGLPNPLVEVDAK